MKRTHLPLNGLRVLDAAARHLSFTRAADELAVTPAAVGQQIRALEDTLGVVLFRRTTKGLELTPEGAAGLVALREGFLQFEEARAYVREVGLESKEQWVEWCSAGHRPEDIPRNPHEKYADDEWLSWRDWLGYGEGQTAMNTFLEFEVARESVWEVGLKSQEQWEQWCREGLRPDTIPYSPDVTYKGEGWLSWPDWLGYGKGRAPRRRQT